MYKSAVEIAKEIRSELKKSFPGVKFSVRKGARRSSVRIKWKNYPSETAVKKVVGKHESFNYDQATGEILNGGNTYILLDHEFSDDLSQEITLKNADKAATIRQCYAIYHLSKIDVREWGLTMQEASNVMSKHKEGVDVLPDLEHLKIEKGIEKPTAVTVSAKKETSQSIVKEMKKEKQDKIEEFEARQEAKAERYEALAVKHQKQGEQRFNSHANQTMVAMQGEPIKIGHHSEYRHRRLQEKAFNDMSKGVEHFNTSKYYAEKAEATAKNNAIYSDDPEAIEKLQDKIKELEQYQAKMKEINKEYRKVKGDIDKMDISDKEKEAFTVDRERDWRGYEGYTPFESWKLSNNNAEIKRCKNRLENLMNQAMNITTEIKIGEIEIVDNVYENRLQIFFPGKPSGEVRSKLKQHGFRWSRFNKAWQRHRSSDAMHWAKEIVQ